MDTTKDLDGRSENVETKRTLEGGLEIFRLLLKKRNVQTIRVVRLMMLRTEKYRVGQFILFCLFPLISFKSQMQ